MIDLDPSPFQHLAEECMIAMSAALIALVGALTSLVKQRHHEKRCR